ncbi:TRAP transporter permease [Paracoccus seriniphilus]|uniref:TRAP transporter, 4TM/12TM fusion protein n=1 Tax=Paracoccus seriniphilus TaxID=184748 RepID=A0A239Q4K9_9RHOB|nr:TRAP transporter permease [Paracoccus seriniphilus]WCR16168.1 TRAP transporter permease [Paracoccus seriniphilus]SNT76877.1 TRAP transporter, 4TM/12TM fusion protein [Paracoccus seriniphilus]
MEIPAAPTTDHARLIEENDLGGRNLTGKAHLTIAGVALLWSLYQLWIASPFPFWFDFLILNDTLQRSIHLAFALALAFLTFPATARSRKDGIPTLDIVLCLIAVATCFYTVVNYESVVLRSGGARTQLEFVVAFAGLGLLLEATRRALGLPMVIIGLVFIGYAFLGPHMPEIISHRGLSLNRFTEHMWLSTEGVFGLPLGVSSGFIFLYVLFGSLLDKAGAGNYFIQLSFGLLGHLRGGPAKAAVISSALTGMISGSAIANVVTTGTFTIPLMKRVGFSPEKAGAIEVSSSINGQIMPPIMGAAAFLMAEFVGISYFEVITHAFIPAFISYFGLYCIVHIEALKGRMAVLERAVTYSGTQRLMRSILTITLLSGVGFGLYLLFEAIGAVFGDNALIVTVLLLAGLYIGLIWVSRRYPEIEVDDPEAPLLKVPAALPIFLAGLSYILPIGVLVWCLMIERFSPALSVSWAILSIFVLLLTQKPLLALAHRRPVGAALWQSGAEDLVSGLIVGARNMTGVAVAMAAAGIIVGVVSATGLGLLMTEIIQTLSGGSFFLMMLLTAGMCVVLGMGLPTTANYIVVAAIMANPFVTLAAEHGIDVPPIAVHLFVFYFGLLSGTTPPVAIDAFAGAAVARSDPLRTSLIAFVYGLRTAILPFIFVLNPALLLIGVESAWHLGLVVGSSIVAMVVFAAGTQGYFFARSRLWESAVLVVVAILLLRPAAILDAVQPPFEREPAKMLLQLADGLEGQTDVRLIAEGENLSGATISKTVVLTLSGEGGQSAEDVLFDSAGLGIEPAGDALLVTDLAFDGQAQKGGLDYDWKILALERSVDRINPNWLLLPLLAIIAMIIALQRGRVARRTEDV